LQLDEIWAFCYTKQCKVPFAKAAPEEAGDIWTWVAIDAATKLIPSWRVGERSGETARSAAPISRASGSRRFQTETLVRQEAGEIQPAKVRPR